MTNFLRFISNKLIRIVRIADYSEAGIFVVLTAPVFLYFLNSAFAESIRNINTVYLLFLSWGMFLWLPGFLVATFHVFTRKQKTLLEAQLVSLSLGILYAFVAFASSSYMYRSEPNFSWLNLFAFWNYCLGWILLLGGLSTFHADFILQQSSRLTETLVGIIIAAGIVLFGEYLQLHWSLILALVLNFETLIRKNIFHLIKARG